MAKRNVKTADLKVNSMSVSNFEITNGKGFISWGLNNSAGRSGLDISCSEYGSMSIVFDVKSNKMAVYSNLSVSEAISCKSIVSTTSLNDDTMQITESQGNMGGGEVFRNSLPDNAFGALPLVIGTYQERRAA